MMTSSSILLVGHGSHLSLASSAPVYAHAAALRASGRYREVGVGFWKEEPSLSRALDALQGDDVTVVPVFISHGYFTQQVIPREMGLAGPLTSRGGRTIRYTHPIGAHPALADVATRRAMEAGAGPADGVAILGHGTARNPESERNVYLQAQRVSASGKFAEVATVFLDQQPHMSDIFSLVRAETVVLVPMFVADGWHVGESIPEDLALAGPETRRGGRCLRYAPAVGTHPAVVGVIEELAAESATW